MRKMLNGKLQCSICNKWKEISSFAKRKDRSYGADSHCKACLNKKLRSRRQHHTKYGLTTSQYASLKQQFGNKCGICGKTEKQNKRKLAIDHEHDSGRVRGLLCKTCNSGIGLLGDSVDGITKALQYLLDADILFENKV